MPHKIVFHGIIFDTMEQNVRDVQDEGHDNKQTPQQEEQQNTQRLCAMAAESLLFVAGRPLKLAELRKLLNVSEDLLLAALKTLEHDLVNQGRGIRLQRLGQQVQLVTAPENAHYIAEFLGLPMTAKLTTASLETLAVIAYRQPVTRSQIEAVRGVNSDRALASLLQHGLVAEVGRAPTLGRPALFATTGDFLQQFGLTSLTDLPEVKE
jgi:segregation and condensation protein B